MNKNSQHDPSSTGEQLESLEKEAEARWGHTEAYRQSRERVAKFTKEDWERIRRETDANLKALVDLMIAGLAPDSPEVQAEIAKHHAGIGRFYDCSLEMYRGIADMYLADQRLPIFTANITRNCRSSWSLA